MYNIEPINVKIQTQSYQAAPFDAGPGAGPGPGGGLGPGPEEHPLEQAAHVSKVYVYSQLPGKMTAVHEFGTNGPDEPAFGQINAIVTCLGEPSPQRLLLPLSRTS